MHSPGAHLVEGSPSAELHRVRVVVQRDANLALRRSGHVGQEEDTETERTQDSFRGSPSGHGGSQHLSQF